MSIKLPFAELLEHGSDIIEVIANDGSELGVNEANILVEHYNRLADQPKVLVNRTHQYSSSAEFMDTMVRNEKFKAIAVYVPGYESALVAESQKFLFSIPFERFLDRDEAIKWLKRQ